jgi:hypothetical protein
MGAMPPRVSPCAIVVLLSVCGISCTQLTVEQPATDNIASCDQAGAAAQAQQQDADGAVAWERQGADSAVAVEQSPHVRPEECRDLGFFDPVPLTDAETACVSHEDCIRRYPSCCPACEPDKLISVNNTAGAVRYSDCCPVVGCPYTPACHGPPQEPLRYPRCLDGKCTIVDFSTE